MDRRSFVEALALTAGASATLGTATQALAAPSVFDVTEKTVAQLQAAMQTGTVNAQQLVQLYLARIAALDKAGPKLNSVIELNPDAMAIAKALDAERKANGPRGPLHGIPVLLKDNIATADGMQTTAGSLALLGAKPPRDAFLVAQLRKAGAIILGKTNLSEWANMRSTRSTSGWSARGGLTRNPYALDRNTSGSSSGSGSSMAASLAAIAVGTETDGSITSPASIAGLVGIKPTLGLVSRAGVIPIAHSQDTAGPMTRTVADAAALLSALAGSDAQDDATALADQKKTDYTQALKRDGLKGKRLGVVRGQWTASSDLVATALESQLAVLRAQGAVLVEVPMVPNTAKYGDSELTVLLYELKADLNAYLAEYAPTAKVKTLADVIAFNEQNPSKELAYFGQEHFIAAQAKGDLKSQEYLDALANNHRYSRAEGIDQVLKEHQLDALIAPTGGTAWLTDFINGDAYGASFTSPAAVAGYPHITVPAGQVRGLPVGLSFVGTAWTEAPLIAMAYAYEQASLQRRAPSYAATAK
ncbi:MAG: amidase [Burkholderiales bacterium PBB3]|nr:MAG: amidase [Burkholderiales bacterium PBB3]